MKGIKSFDSVFAQVEQGANAIGASGGALYVIHKNQVAFERYFGKQSIANDARSVQADTQFHIASVRKSYIGFALAYAVHHGYIKDIDQSASQYLPTYDQKMIEGVTIRHLLTHSHGLVVKEEMLTREFVPGTNWAYRGAGIPMLAAIVKQATGKTIADILHSEVFKPLSFLETGWYGEKHAKLADVVRDVNDKSWSESTITDGAEMNMYVSARDLANWGNLHLTKGMVNGEQKLPADLFTRATSMLTPPTLQATKPTNGYMWFVQGEQKTNSERMEIGRSVALGAFQLLGYSNVAVLVIPKHEVVAVRMINRFGSPEGFDFLANIRAFGDAVEKVFA
ncbi:CubicO group peptidase (beta-lactamase class C family) [Alkalihalobacillus xiaoxiensis]|uniref:CubicO group peptidase (Beta-lactamase class C family) n=1 Tax=Shouchella xiaoxiensis TaxID=766895 RepID=A0ABS2SVC1_9BACI|nr:serine hydrolase domain-containing protein [Shouchella xiaoxiensis]MBM7839483.1 CubicO group peptidase (beta-lactamase class C family) [Shouchella xiaoxiensis]